MPLADIPRIPRLLGVIFRLIALRRKEIRSQRPFDSQNGEQLGLAVLKRAALAASRRISPVVACGF
jgi:hypothetical protein